MDIRPRADLEALAMARKRKTKAGQRRSAQVRTSASAGVRKSAVSRPSSALRKSVLMKKIEASKSAKLDLYARHKNEYLASPIPSIVRVGPAMYLAYDGRGKSGATPEFATGIGALYNVAFTMKMGFKAQGKDYVVTKLEALWSPVSGEPAPGIDWDWTLLIRVPAFVTAADVQKTIDDLVAKGKPADVLNVKLIELREDQCVQILHVGSYADEAPSIAKMKEFAARTGRRFHGRHHEIYLSDPNKTAGDKLRTILRQPVA